MKPSLIFRLTIKFVVVVSLCTSFFTQARVTINSTRIVYPANESEVTIQLNNEGAVPALVQTWVDRGDASAQSHNADAPFLIKPPIFRLDPKKGQTVRLVFTGEALPQDRETVFYFNALEIPPVSPATDESQIQVGVRSRLKLFYRPVGLPGNAANAAKQVKWTLVPVKNGYALRGDNASPYYVSYAGLTLVYENKKIDVGQGMIDPFGINQFPIKGFAGKHSKTKLTLKYRWMSDYGVGTEEQADVL